MIRTLLLIPAAASQTGAQEFPRLLTLDDAMAMAFDRNPDARSRAVVARCDARRAEAGLRTAMGAWAEGNPQ